MGALVDGGVKYRADLAEFQGGIDTGNFEGPVTPNAFFSFGNGIMKYFVYNDPDWTYENYNFENEAKSVVMADRIMGCPHEEGVGYPDGSKCPKCPFWAIRDRFTGEKIQ